MTLKLSFMTFSNPASPPASSCFCLENKGMMLKKACPCEQQADLSHLFDDSLKRGVDEMKSGSPRTTDSIDNHISALTFDPNVFSSDVDESESHQRLRIHKSSITFQQQNQQNPNGCLGVLVRKRRVGLTKEQRQIQDEYRKKCLQLTFRRLLKNDIRRDYPTMYFNVLNSSNDELMRSFFQKYCQPTCILVDHMQSKFFQGQPVITYGASCIAEVYIEVGMLVPDIVTLLKAAHVIRKFKEEGSIVVIDSHLAATRVVATNNGGEDVNAKPAITSEKVDMAVRTKLFLDKEHQITRITVE